jgi:uncharacterized protein YbjT (DUF2867 family)
MSASDVAQAVGRVAVGPALNGMVEVAGPERFRLDELVRQGLRAWQDPREVVADPSAYYYGSPVDELSLVPGDGARIAETRFEVWLNQPAVPR